MTMEIEEHLRVMLLSENFGEISYFSSKSTIF